MMSPRRLIAGVGRSLITAGVLLLLFVAYQLWGTGIAYAQRQDKAEAAFQALLADAGIDASAPLVPKIALPSSPDTEPTDADTEPTVVAATEDVVVGGDVAPPTTRPAVTTSTLPKVRAGRSKMQRPPAGKALGRIVIPRIRLDQIVVEGADKESLKTGPGHYVRSPMPGQPGNAAIACHRTTYGAPCFNLDLVRPGDEIFVQTVLGTFRYVTEKSWKVTPTDSSVLAPTDDNVLTLTTCDPKYSAARRLIVRARLDGEALPADLFLPPEEPVAAPVTAADTIAFEIDPSTVAEPSSDTELTTDSVVDTVAGEAPGTAPASEIATTEPPSVSTGSLTTVDPQGSGPLWSFLWFHGHRSTWLETLALAGVCALIWILTWLLARRRRLLGQALIYIPAFVLLFGPVLFFCFEHVARLLPDSV